MRMLLKSGFSVTFDGPGCSRTPAAAAGASMAVVTTKEEREDVVGKEKRREKDKFGKS